MKSTSGVSYGFLLAGLAGLSLVGCDSGGGVKPAGTGGQTVPAGSSGGSQSSGGTIGSGGTVGSGGSGGSGGNGGAVGNGGTNATGGRVGSGGTSGSGGGSAGATGSGGRTETGGQPGTGGAPGAGGRGTGGAGTGGASTTGSGGSSATGGAPGTGGRGTGGAPGSGGRATGGSPGAGGTTSAGGSTGTGTCPHALMKGTDFCTIGDSWIQIPGNQVTTLENHLVAAGVIPSGDHFDRREVSGSTLSSIIGTYTSKPSNCKILVMDGGGIDLFSTAAGDQAAIDPVVKKFTDFLAQVKTLGYTQHIIYSLYPVIPTTKNLNVNMKPGFSAACAASAVDCHLVDLEPLFKGQHFGSDNTHPDNAGGVIIGDAWWQAMQANCIAQ